MNNSGDAAEQVVRLSLEGTEVALKLTGSAAKNIAAAIYAVLKNRDMVAQSVGMRAFLLTDCLINKERKDINQFRRGSFDQLTRYLADETSK